jgi:hypothetical protein
MWSTRITLLPGDRVLKCCIDIGSSPLSYANVLDLWQNDASFRNHFIQTLAKAPFPAFRWETPAVTIGSINQPFEFVLLDSPDLATRPDPCAFSEHFPAAQAGGVVEFANLGGDAVLVVPCPDDPPLDYAHLAAFLRHAPVVQQHALWQAVAAAMQRRLGSRPVWLSAAGGGVAWLHLRLDDRPKYYAYAAYRNAAWQIP